MTVDAELSGRRRREAERALEEAGLVTISFQAVSDGDYWIHVKDASGRRDLFSYGVDK